MNQDPHPISQMMGDLFGTPWIEPDPRTRRYNVVTTCHVCGRVVAVRLHHLTRDVACDNPQCIALLPPQFPEEMYDGSTIELGIIRDHTLARNDLVLFFEPWRGVPKIGFDVKQWDVSP